jgi:hypothetical protein
MIKNKPYAHVKPGDTLIIRDMWGRDHRYPIVKAEDWSEDYSYVRLTFPEVKDQDGRVVEESTEAVFNRNEQAFYEVN